jgi:Kae1-associated kinase Bud32
MHLELEHIEGVKVRDLFDHDDEKLKRKVCRELGKTVKKMHQNDIIHGDLTTSNMIWNDKLYLIDFGLGKISIRVEDMAVDIHLLKECFRSKHHVHWKTYWNEFKKAYNQDKVFAQLERVEARARYNKVS